MFVLDTNHLRELSFKTVLGRRLEDRILSAKDAVVTTIVCAEEMQRGWLARISTASKAVEAEEAYVRFSESIHFLASFVLLPWDVQADEQLQSFRKAGVRIGAMDLKIACITLEHEAVPLPATAPTSKKFPASVLRTGWTEIGSS